MPGKNKTEDLQEFNSSSGVSSTADPYDAGDASRSADKSAGETSYSDSTKSEVLSAIMNHISGLNKDALVNIYKAYGPTGSSSRSADKGAGEVGQVRTSPTAVTGTTGGEAVNKGGSAPTTHSSKTGKGEDSQLHLSPTAVKPSYKEDVEEIFGGDELSEEIKNKASVVFEAAVNARVIVETARLEEEFETRLSEAVDEVRSEVVDNVDKYLSYAVEEWVEENKVAIDAGLKVEMAEDLISGLKGLFEANYIEIPETKVDVVAEMTEKVEELEQKLNEQIEKNHDLKEKNTALKVEKAFLEMTEGLAETQVEKLRTLVEGVSYDSAKDYKSKLSVIKETYFPSSPKQPEESTVVLTEEVSSESESEYVEPTSGPMAAYVKTATRLSKTANQ
jgi:hypothetical protein